MFGTRRLDRFDLQAFRQSKDDQEPTEDDSRRATVDAEGLVTESGELPVTRPEEVTKTECAFRVDPKAATTKAAPLEIPTPLVDFRPATWTDEETTRKSPEVSRALAKKNSDALRTRVTKRFVSLAELVNEAFAGIALGQGGYVVELTAPKDMSTNGGKLAMELLRLRPRIEGYAVVLAGTLNARRAELREYEYVADWHLGRFNRPLPFSRQTWEEFLQRAEAIFREAGVESVRVQPTRELRREEQPMARVSKPATIALVATLSLAIIACARVAMLLLHR